MTQTYDEYQMRAQALEVALRLDNRRGAAELVQSATIIEDYLRGGVKR